MKPLYKKYGNCIPIGTKHLTNTFGIVLFEPLEDDKFDCDFISAYWHDGMGYSRFARIKAHTTSNGRLYVLKNNIKYYLDEFLRTDL